MEGCCSHHSGSRHGQYQTEQEPGHGDTFQGSHDGTDPHAIQDYSPPAEEDGAHAPAAPLGTGIKLSGAHPAKLAINGATAPASGQGTKLSANLPPALEKYRSLIEEASQMTGVPANLIAAQIWQESRGDPRAGTPNPANGKDDLGLMQINTDTFADLRRKHPEIPTNDRFDPRTNIRAGAFYMQDLLKQTGGDVHSALGIYVGIGVGGDNDYMQKVIGFYNTLNAGGSLPP